MAWKRVGSCTWSQVFDDLDQSKKLLFDTRKSGFQVWPGNFWYHTQAKIWRTSYILWEMVEFEGIQCVFRFHGIPDFQTHPRLLLQLMWCFCPGLQGGVLAKWWTSTWDRHLGFRHAWLLSLAMFDFWSFILVYCLSFSYHGLQGPQEVIYESFWGSEILGILLVDQWLPSWRECLPTNAARRHNSLTFATWGLLILDCNLTWIHAIHVYRLPAFWWLQTKGIHPTSQKFCLQGWRIAACCSCQKSLWDSRNICLSRCKPRSRVMSAQNSLCKGMVPLCVMPFVNSFPESISSLHMSEENPWSPQCFVDTSATLS